MKIIKCYIDNFGKLSKSSFNFTNNLNCIYKENGYGKSTLASFLITMMFGLNNTRSNDIDEKERKKFFPWNEKTSKFGGYIDIEKDNNDQIRIERWFDEESSKKDEIKIIDLKTNKQTSKSKDIGEETFLMDRITFERCIYFSQINFNISKKEKNQEIRDSLQKKFTSLITNETDENIKKAIEKLQKQKEDYFTKQRGKGEKNTKIQDEIISKKNELEKIKNSENEKSELILENEKLKKYEKKYEQNLEIKRTESARIKLESDVLNNELNEINKFFNNTDIEINKINEFKKHLSEKQNHKKNIDKIEDEINKISQKINEQKYKWNKKIIIDDYQKWNIDLKDINKERKQITWKKCLRIIFGLIFIWSIVPIILYLKSKKNDKKKIKSLKNALEKYGYELLQNNNHEYFIDPQIKNDIENFSQLTDQIENYEIQKNLEKTLISNCEIEIKKLTNLIDSFNWKHEENSYELSWKIWTITDKLNKKIEITNRINKNGLGNQNDEFESKSNEQNLQIIKNKIERNNFEIERLSNTTDNKEKIENEIETLKKIDDQNKKEIELITKTIDFLQKTKDEMTNQYLPKLQNSFEKYINELDNKIQNSHFIINEDFTIQVEQNGKRKEINYYSKGYQDLFNICLKFALIDTLFEKHEKPFVILDDPFINLDNEKLKKAKDLIRKFSKKFQIIYLTCHDSRKI